MDRKEHFLSDERRHAAYAQASAAGLGPIKNDYWINQATNAAGCRPETACATTPARPRENHVLSHVFASLCGLIEDKVILLGETRALAARLAGPLDWPQLTLEYKRPNDADVDMTIDDLHDLAALAIVLQDEQRGAVEALRKVLS